MEKINVLNRAITVVLLLISMFMGFLIVNMVYPPKFEIFTSNYTDEAIKEYFDTVDLGIVLIGAVPVFVLILLNKIVSIVYKNFSLDKTFFLFEALAAGIIIYFLSKEMNFGITAEISYFLDNYFWL